MRRAIQQQSSQRGYGKPGFSTSRSPALYSHSHTRGGLLVCLDDDSSGERSLITLRQGMHMLECHPTWIILSTLMRTVLCSMIKFRATVQFDLLSKNRMESNLNIGFLLIVTRVSTVDIRTHLILRMFWANAQFSWWATVFYDTYIHILDDYYLTKS